MVLYLSLRRMAQKDGLRFLMLLRLLKVKR
jgi:hypothetical protein